MMRTPDEETAEALDDMVVIGHVDRTPFSKKFNEFV